MDSVVGALGPPLTVSHCAPLKAGYPASEALLRAACEARGLQLHTLCMSELAKADGALTCCSLLFTAPPPPPP
jgi:hypothetical protein